MGIIRRLKADHWLCVPCKRPMGNEADLVHHVLVHHVHAHHVPQHFPCPLCEHVSKTANTRQKHIKLRHDLKLTCREIRNMTDSQE
jgi:hypothetical protein